MQYAGLAGFFERLEATPSRLGTTAVLVELLQRLEPAEVEPVVRLLQGAVAPEWEGIELGLAEKQVLRAVATASGVSAKQDEGARAVEALYHETGDLGLAAERVLSGRGARQSSLFAPAPLEILDVFARLKSIAAATGAGSQEAKQRLLSKLLLDASPLEARYIVRTVAGRLRLGVADMTVLDALAAWHLGLGVRSVQDMEDAERARQSDVRRRLERAYDRRSDLALVATTLAKGLEAVDALHLEFGVPVRPMLAEREPTMAGVLERMGGRAGVEYKYDGLRLQIHLFPVEGDRLPAAAASALSASSQATHPRRVKIFSRRLEDLTQQFPDVIAAVREAFAGTSGIMEGEVVAVDATGRIRPFQEVSRRRGRKTGLESEAVTTLAGQAGLRLAGGDVTKEVPVALALFDVLSLDGEELLAKPYAERRAALSNAFRWSHEGTNAGPVRLSVGETVTDEEAMEAFLQRAVEAGAEGMMCKNLDAPYKAGGRGFGWIKYKADYTAELVDSMDLVVIGAFHGHGRRAGWLGTLLVAAYDPDTGTFPSVCKVGTGFDDAILAAMRAKFEATIVATRPRLVESGMEPDVWIEPTTVLEVQAAELTLSPVHRAAWGQVKPGAGLAARFPRFMQWRDDKTPEQCTTVEELVRMHRAQADRTNRAGAAAADSGSDPA